MYLLILVLLLVSVYSVISTSSKLCRGTFRLTDFDVRHVLPLRGLLALLIIVHHLSQYVSFLQIRVINQFIAWGAPVVQIFFFITGYGLMTSYRAKGTAYFNGFLPRRMGKLLPAFILANIIWLCWGHYSGGKGVYAAFAEMLHGGTPLPNSWFIYTVILFYIIFYIFARTIRSIPRMLLVLWLASTVYCVILWMAHWGGWWYKSVYALNVGMTYAFYEGKVKIWILSRPKNIILLFAVLMVGMCLLLLIHRHKEYGPSWQIIDSFILPLLVVLSVYCVGTPKLPALDFLGKISYEIYLVHGCFIVLFSGMREQWPLYFIAVFVSSIAAAWLLHVICKSLPHCGRGR